MKSNYRCNGCGKRLNEKEALYLHENIGLLRKGYYYCKLCTESAEEGNETISRKEDRRSRA